jgi:N-acetylneuraminate synthase
MSGGSGDSRRVLPRAEIEYLDALVRGAYARRALGPGYVFDSSTFSRDFYLAIPLQKGQLSCREVMNGERLVLGLEPNQPLTIDHIDGPYSENAALRRLIADRGL